MCQVTPMSVEKLSVEKLSTMLDKVYTDDQLRDLINYLEAVLSRRDNERSQVLNHTMTDPQPECTDCHESPGFTDWETLEDIPLCCSCAERRILDRGTAPPEWLSCIR